MWYGMPGMPGMPYMDPHAAERHMQEHLSEPATVFLVLK